MKILLERHEYAPELNRAYIFHKGRQRAVLPCAGARNIKEARAHLFPRALFAIVATVEKKNAAYPSLNRVWAGVVASRAAAIEFKRARESEAAGGILIDGTMLPASTITVKTKLMCIKGAKS